MSQAMKTMAEVEQPDGREEQDRMMKGNNNNKHKLRQATMSFKETIRC